MSKSKTAEEMSEFLTKIGEGLNEHVTDHPRLRGLISQINKKAVSLTKPAAEGKPVQLSYHDGSIHIESAPFLHAAKFGAWRWALAKAKGVETSTRVTNDGDTVPVYEPTYDKDLGKNVLPEARKEQLLQVIADFFPDSPIQEV
jgi:hypothetical protein